jgi:hypothetical protein
MTDECGIYDLPLEMLGILASTDVAVYRALLALPLFARSLSPGKVVDFMIAFGYTVEITADYIKWYLNGEKHRVDEPAIEWNDGSKEWWLYGNRHRMDGPSVVWMTGIKEWWRFGKKT